MIKWVPLSILVCLGLFSSNASAVCNFERPHSFDCQDATFNGAIFPLVGLRGTGALSQNWFANQFTAGSREAVGMFETVISPTDARRTCSLLNEDGTSVGRLLISATARGVGSARMGNFRSTNFKTNRPGGFEDAQTVVFANTATSQIFKCRIFQRANTNHLTCQYFEDNRFVGYLGFLPFQQNCR